MVLEWKLEASSHEVRINVCLTKQQLVGAYCQLPYNVASVSAVNRFSSSETCWFIGSENPKILAIFLKFRY